MVSMMVVGKVVEMVLRMAEQRVLYLVDYSDVPLVTTKVGNWDVERVSRKDAWMAGLWADALAVGMVVHWVV